MAPVRIDLFSDTLTKPSAAMRRAMAEAEVGDEQKFEDPTTTRLQERVAALLGKEAAVFVPSGTMCNMIACRVHCRLGDKIFLEELYHPVVAEGGGYASNAGATLHLLRGERGMYAAAQVEEAITPPSDRYAARPRLVWIEQTTNMGGGAVWPVERMREVAGVARRHGLAVHMDGARLLNASVAASVPARDYAALVDSTWLDFSKGLGAPVGAALAGSAEFIAEAWRVKQQLGGSMRQSGVLAAACLFALDHNVERLAEDHANAARLAEELAAIPKVRVEPVETNIVIFDIGETGLARADFLARTLEHGVRFSHVRGWPTRVRAVTHLDIAPAMISEAAQAVRGVLSHA